jgi:hypothetical protein
MSLPVVSPTLFNAQALPADPADTHLQAGVHLRVGTNPLLGLPVAPFVVYRAIAKQGEDLKLRSDAVFVDSRGTLVAPPFTLAPDNPVTAYLSLLPGDVCLWAQVIADPFKGTPTGGGGRPGVPPSRPPVRPPLVPGAGGPRPSPVRPAEARVDGGRVEASRRAGNLVAGTKVSSGIVATAFVGTSQGPSPIGRRSEPAYSFSGPGIVQILLEGTGAVVGVGWLEQGDIPALNFVPWTVLNLPHEGGARYLSIDGALARAALRVLEQAPRRRPLQETLGAVAPAAAPVEGPLYEAKRVESLAKPIGPSLDRLVTDLSAPALELIETDPIFFLTGQQRGTATQRCIDRVLGGQLDPGTAALLGYKGLDSEFKSPAPFLVFYWVSGFFRDFPPSTTLPPQDPIFDAQLALLSGESVVGDEGALLVAFETLIKGLNNVQVNAKTLPALEKVGDYIGLGALAVADLGAPPDPMLPPVIDAATHVGWLPVTPPDARREVEVTLSGVATAGMLAAEKQTPDGGAVRAQLNKANDDGYHLPLVLGMDSDDPTLPPVNVPGTGFIADRQGAPDTIRYAVAQQDPFGRWSDWVSALSLPGPRPAPPRPVIRGTYTQPADPATSGGAVRVQADIPRLDTLAPGAYPIAQLEITATDQATLAVTVHVATTGDPLAPDDAIDLTFTGPLLAPTERRRLQLVAVWRDTAGTPSVESEPLGLRLNDPRPPTQLTVPDALQYSGRPDVLGLSMVEYAWTPVAGQSGFGVYYTDENRLTAYLAGSAAGTAGATVRDALAATTDPAARATLFRANGALFPAHLFERLREVVYDTASGQKAFRHAVSGSLRVLNLYRISAESETSARVDLATLPLLVFAVPNADPPPRPVITVVPDDVADNGATYSATVTIILTAGATTASTWRLRRSSLGATDVLRMPIVTTGPMGPVGTDGRQLGTWQDTGPVLIADDARLKPWVRYTWVAETQGDFAPGSVAAGRPVPGAWSAPSEPVSVMLVPPRVPEPAEAVTATGTPVGGGELTGVAITFTHPRVLSGGAAGSYRVRVMRRAPGGPMEALSEVETGGAAGPYTVSGMRPGDAADQVASGTLYRLVIIDPLGRESTPAEGTLP